MLYYGDEALAVSDKAVWANKDSLAKFNKLVEELDCREHAITFGVEGLSLLGAVACCRLCPVLLCFAALLRVVGWWLWCGWQAALKEPGFLV
jgi:hypothetical protein